ncbi:hypothetical protein [Streptococcus sp. sy018]|uniref:hypothetical protein n=1 Tax=Streptococcus sp. sy018 TaxID=2600147 RepID=UPI0011B5CF08|nr:hypothetical protein [Streptococcus sp. sy018]TWS95560.1 hypothetical protein FRX52_01810 [Streptococcus sp. sy018]
MKQFELWLDESGKFDETSNSKELYSFVGGVLVDKEQIKHIDFSLLLNNSQYNHAMTLSPKQKKQYVFPKLIELKKQTNARYVYFENIEYLGTGDNRELYLQVMAEGLLQLVQLLEAKYGNVHLNITIASRVAQKDGQDFVHIKEEEYSQTFREVLKQRKERNEIAITHGSQVHFHLERATQSQKLIIADFASNTRRIYKRQIFRDANSRCLFDEIFSDVLTFSMSELSSDVKIRILLAQNDISEALMEVFLSPTLSKKQDYLQLVVSRMEHLSYRILKSQLKQLSSEILSFIARQDDYQKNIQILEEFEYQLIPFLKTKEFPCEVLEFEVLLQLSDIYLRSGQLLPARQILEKALKLLKEVGSTLENLFILYRVMEKISVLYIDSFQFHQAASLMEEVRHIFKNTLNNIEDFPLIATYFNTLKSEYYGDVLCMEIYAKLFLLPQYHNDDNWIQEIRLLSDEALKHYPNFEGELERHYQYRSRLEASVSEEPLPALNWLIKAALYHHDLTADYSEETIKQFWDRILQQETEISQLFYLMYFSIIIDRSSKYDPNFADKLYEQLLNHEISHLLFPDSSKKDYYLIKRDKVADYHPKEIIYWNLANYYVKKELFKEALTFYDCSLNICEKKKATITLQLRMIAILAARASVEVRLGKTAASYKKIFSRLTSLKSRIGQIESSQDLSLIKTMELLDKWEGDLLKCLPQSDDFSEQLWAFSQRWRY